MSKNRVVFRGFLQYLQGLRIMNRNHQSTAFWSVLSIVSIFLGMIFFLGVPRYRIILSDISDPHELQFLKFMREDLSQIEAWSPRFANKR